MATKSGIEDLTSSYSMGVSQWVSVWVSPPMELSKGLISYKV